MTYFYSLLFQSWDAFFRQTARGAPPGQAYTPPPYLHTVASSVPAALPGHAVEQGLPVDEKTIEDHLSVQSIIRSYQVNLIIETFTMKLVVRLNNLDGVW